jgi:predicted ATP-grasp superfamily ATP-dependent carboligase
LQYPPRGFFGKAIVYAPRDSIWEKTPVPFLLNDIPHAGQRLTAGNPVVTVVAEGQSPADVKAALRQHVATIQRLLTPLQRA